MRSLIVFNRACRGALMSGSIGGCCGRLWVALILRVAFFFFFRFFPPLSLPPTAAAPCCSAISTRPWQVYTYTCYRICWISKVFSLGSGQQCSDVEQTNLCKQDHACTHGTYWYTPYAETGSQIRCRHCLLRGIHTEFGANTSILW